MALVSYDDLDLDPVPEHITVFVFQERFWPGLSEDAVTSELYLLNDPGS